MRVIYFLLLFVLFSSCSDGDGKSSSTCKDVIISSSQFQDLDPNQVSIVSTDIVGDCITVVMGISGCDDTHEIEMISDGSIAESFPPQITFDFKDVNPQLCLAFFQIEREFDLSAIQDLEGGDIWINFRNSEVRKLYQP